MTESTILEENMESLHIGEEIIDKEFKFEVKSDDNTPSISSSSPAPPTTNRRYSLRPIKQKESTNQFKASSKKKRLSLPGNVALETIFEDPVYRNGSLKLLGKKLKRFISFNDFVSKTKFKHRLSKIKRLPSKIKKVKMSSKLTAEDVKKKLESLEETEEDKEWMEITG
uniref:Tantalus-like domain-containing protein n=1 Tax=Graphocephala atropunctata TaxID=36148 RepID=A0A1B6KVK0_9HEMI